MRFITSYRSGQFGTQGHLLVGFLCMMLAAWGQIVHDAVSPQTKVSVCVRVRERDRERGEREDLERRAGLISDERSTTEDTKR